MSQQATPGTTQMADVRESDDTQQVSLGSGAIAGIVIGTLIVVAILVYAMYSVFYRDSLSTRRQPRWMDNLAYKFYKWRTYGFFKRRRVNLDKNVPAEWNRTTAQAQAKTQQQLARPLPAAMPITARSTAISTPQRNGSFIIDTALKNTDGVRENNGSVGSLALPGSYLSAAPTTTIPLSPDKIQTLHEINTTVPSAEAMSFKRTNALVRTEEGKFVVLDRHVPSTGTLETVVVLDDESFKTCSVMSDDIRSSLPSHSSGISADSNKVSVLSFVAGDEVHGLCVVPQPPTSIKDQGLRNASLDTHLMRSALFTKQQQDDIHRSDTCRTMHTERPMTLGSDRHGVHPTEPSRLPAPSLATSAWFSLQRQDTQDTVLDIHPFSQNKTICRENTIAEETVEPAVYNPSISRLASRRQVPSLSEKMDYESWVRSFQIKVVANKHNIVNKRSE